MAEKGYFLVPEDQAEARRAEFAAVAEEKRKQEAAATARPAPLSKPVTKRSASGT
jgi:hypothetical protein